ncbi:M48 family metallopeptidase [Patescibacteria group bacterium]|nr:M48 family metallopeptidase [Patescibacteria group bacterium]
MTHYDLVASNQRKSWFILAGFLVFVIGVVYVLSAAFGFSYDFTVFAIGLTTVMSFGSYWWSDKIVLAISGARPATREEFFDYYTVTENLVMSQRMKMPKLFVIDDTAMNAFATGRDPDHAAVVATTGLLSRLNRAEIEGVVAHELSHIKNYDIRLMAVVSVLVGSIALISDLMLRMTAWGGTKRDRNNDSQIGMILFLAGIVLAILSPIVAQLIQLAISRRREFLADASGVAMTKNPQGLIRALGKISHDTEPLEAANKATAHLYISDPLKNIHGGVGMFANLFQTHPPVTERIKALESI